MVGMVCEMKKKAKKGKAGRPRKITLAVVNKVGALLALGMPQEYACALNGVNASTFASSVCINEELKEALRIHHARFMRDALKSIKEGGKRIMLASGDGMNERLAPWTGLAWILERRYKPHFNRTDTHAITDDKGTPMFAPADLEELAKIGRELTALQEAKRE